MSFAIIQFDKRLHDYSGFNCGTATLNRYLKEQANQDMRRHYAALFVAVDKFNKIIGFYTLSSASINLSSLPDELQKKLPKYPQVPSVRLGRLAVDKSMQGQRLGTSLVANAALRSMSNVADWAVMAVDAKNERAVAFYSKIGFSRLNDDNLHLFIMRTKLEKLIGENTETTKSSQSSKRGNAPKNTT
jgi:ribosomal protein S18 acetylase RimI-like enzyme